jgi:L-alanine-DL-glutamate epimerase-like enolase superfamily enzyme
VRILRILERTVPMASDIRNAVIDFSAMTASVVAVVTDEVRDGEPVVGYGFNSNGRYAQGGILRERIIPRLESAKPGALLTDDESNIDPHRCWAVMMANEKPGGHGERSVAVGTIDMALWDAVAKIEGRPLAALLADRYGGGSPEPDVEVYAAGGYYSPGKGTEALERELRSYLDRGYDAVKMKVGGASLEEDLVRIEAALGVVGDADRLAVDANARFSVDEAVRFAEAIEGFGLKWYEEPCDPLDFAAMAAVCASTKTTMATGENLFSTTDARNLIRYGGMSPERDVLQFDPVLSYGLVEYLRTLDMLDRHGWSRRRCVPHGGHQFALHIAAGLGLGGNESYPDVFHPFGGFADDEPVVGGRVKIPDAPGIGFELKRELFRVLSALGPI